MNNNILPQSKEQQTSNISSQATISNKLAKILWISQLDYMLKRMKLYRVMDLNDIDTLKRGGILKDFLKSRRPTLLQIQSKQTRKPRNTNFGQEILNYKLSNHATLWSHKFDTIADFLITHQDIWQDLQQMLLQIDNADEIYRVMDYGFTAIDILIAIYPDLRPQIGRDLVEYANKVDWNYSGDHAHQYVFSRYWLPLFISDLLQDPEQWQTILASLYDMDTELWPIRRPTYEFEMTTKALENIPQWRLQFYELSNKVDGRLKKATFLDTAVKYLEPTLEQMPQLRPQIWEKLVELINLPQVEDNSWRYYGNPIKVVAPLITRYPDTWQDLAKVMIQNDSLIYKTTSSSLYLMELLEKMPDVIEKNGENIHKTITDLHTFLNSELCTTQIIWPMEYKLIHVYNQVMANTEIEPLELAKDIQDIVTRYHSIYKKTDKRKAHWDVYEILCRLWEWMTSLQNRKAYKDIVLKKVIRSKKHMDNINSFKEYDVQNKLSSFAWSLSYLAKYKKKSFMPFIEKLSSLNRLDQKLNLVDPHNRFTPLTSLNTKEISSLLSWDTYQQTQLYATYAKIYQLTWMQKQGIRNNFTLALKMAHQNPIPQHISALQKNLIPFITEYFLYIFDKKVAHKIHKELWETNIKIDRNLLTTPEFTTCLEFTKADKTGKLCIDLLKNYVEWKTYPHIQDITQAYPYTIKSNRKFLRKLWAQASRIRLSSYSQTYQINQQGSDKQAIHSQLNHYTQQAKAIIIQLGKKAKIDKLTPGELCEYADKHIFPNQSETDKKSDQYNDLIQDLKVQISALKWLFIERNTDIPTSITISRALDPLEVCMMGDWVTGSCLHSDSVNHRSVYVNATDANKWVYYIRDEKWRILWRVLTAIDKNKKLLRFHIYQAGGATWINLEKYVNIYLKQLAEDMWIGINGDIKKVSYLNAMRWYKDPVVEIQ